jgi:monoamine oxidase
MAVARIALVQFRLDRLARTVPIEAPWTAARAAKWDAETVGSYLRRTRISSGIGHDLYEMAVRGLFAAELDDVSFLHLLYLVRAHGSINTLFSIEGGSQENMVDGGAGSIAERVAHELGDAVHLNEAVLSIEQRGDRVVVRSAGRIVSAWHAVVAVPPSTVVEMEFDPVLPDDRAGLLRSAVGGMETKTLVVYDEPFWRADGLRGQTAQPNSPAEVTIDGSPSPGPPGCSHPSHSVSSQSASTRSMRASDDVRCSMPSSRDSVLAPRRHPRSSRPRGGTSRGREAAARRTSRRVPSRATEH